jgi:hypothetical protein
MLNKTLWEHQTVSPPECIPTQFAAVPALLSSATQSTASSTSEEPEKISKKSSASYLKDKEQRIKQYKLKAKITQAIELILEDLELLIDIKNDLKQF